MAIDATCLWASVDDVKPWLRLLPSDVKADGVLEQLANAATAELERLTGRVFVSRSITDRFDSRRRARFPLRGYPVTAIDTFTIDGVAVDASLYSLDSEAGVLTLRAGAWWSSTGVDDVVVTYTAGYARASVPAGVLQAGVELLAFTYQQWASGLANLSSAQLGGASFSPAGAMPWALKDRIESLRLEVRAGLA